MENSIRYSFQFLHQGQHLLAFFMSGPQTASDIRRTKAMPLRALALKRISPEKRISALQAHFGSKTALSFVNHSFR